MGLALVLAGLLLTSSAFAAEVTASLLGTIRDASGAVVTGATISLTNTQTNVTKKTQSGNDGEYSFTLVPVGQYRLMVERSGFRKYVQDGIILQVNQAAKQDISLEVGAQTEVVEVTGDVAQVDTVTATLGSVETQRRIVDLPLVERDTFQLGLLQAGVFAPDPDDGSGNPFSVSGQRSESLTFLIDGVDNNDFLGNNAVVDPNPDAVEEFKILTNNYGAEYGRTSGGIVNQVIKSGTNAFHGGVFEFFRNDDLNARNYFQLERTRFNRNLFGGTLGGPIHKDKTFFFISYQGSRRIEGQVAPVLTVLSPAQRGCTTVAPGCVGTVADFSGDLPDTQLVNPIDGTDYPNNQVPINPIIATYISKYLPLPNVPGTDNFAANPIGRIQEDQGIVRIDHHLTGRDTIYGNWIINDVRDAYPFRIINGASSGGNVPDRFRLLRPDPQPAGSGHLDPYFQPARHQRIHLWLEPRRHADGDTRGYDFARRPGIHQRKPRRSKGVAPPIMFSNTFQLGPSPQGPTKEHDVTFHWQDSVSWNKGHHDLKFGADIRRIRNNFNFDFFNNGSFDFANFVSPFTGDGFADFVGGFPDNYFQFSNAVYGIRTYSLNFYGQDSWKILLV